MAETPLRDWARRLRVDASGESGRISATDAYAIADYLDAQYFKSLPVESARCCEHAESEHETQEYRGDKARHCLAEGCQCKRWFPVESAPSTPTTWRACRASEAPSRDVRRQQGLPRLPGPHLPLLSGLRPDLPRRAQTGLPKGIRPTGLAGPALRPSASMKGQDTCLQRST